MATLDTETVDRLNTLLEDERASVEIEVALVDGATELYERDVFNAMASADVLGCCMLRERLEEQDVPVTRQINGVALHILGVETYDERLLAFARLQESIRERAQSLLGTLTDREMMRVLHDIADAHARFDGWCEQRAREFAESREQAFADSQSSAAEAGAPDGAVSGTPSTAVPNATLDAMQDAALTRDSDPDTGGDGADASREEGNEGDQPRADRGRPGSHEQHEQT